MVPGDGSLDLRVEAETAVGLNRVRHSLTGLITFNARSETLSIEWQGDVVGPTLPPDLRVLTVANVRDVTPRMRRVSFTGEDLWRFAPLDQLHARLLFSPKDAGDPEWPRLDDDGGILWPGGRQTIGSRVYTIRTVDPVAGTMAIDFVLHPHGGGPGIEWVRSARVGDIVGILGPAAHGLRPASHYLLAGDETGLPGIARILEALPPHVGGVAMIEVEDAQEEQTLAAPGGVELRWLHRNGRSPGTTSLLDEAVRATPGMPPDTFVWAGCEFQAFRAIRSYLREIGLPRAQQVCFPHWRAGMSEEDIVEVGAQAVAE
ncbi:NADPH-dependent ferric siderophore reductase [Aureimonas pseudogalii]|uniref:NADPH-dependent ferric siderophore reductase n=2 Tax=Aureimonas pseudogalii TaxID=1744844 RepID=A0A7W6H809_9HYPH|nr:NADPH-dependent ferric siderophore reductase [Aureimonas pseudogalii]